MVLDNGKGVTIEKSAWFKPFLEKLACLYELKSCFIASFVGLFSIIR